MELISFLLEVNGEIVRDIKFKSGLNLITSNPSSKKPGNSIGKSTLGRIIDYLFDGSIGPIYIDEEFSTPNKDIEAFLDDNTVFAILNYVSCQNKPSKVSRRLSTQKELQEYYVDGINVVKGEYVTHILESFFNVLSSKPTLRKLAPKFLRTNSYRMLHTVHFDDSRNYSSADLSTVFLYLFGFSNTELLSCIHKLRNAIAKHSRHSKSFGAVIQEEKILGSVTTIKKEIAKLDKSLDSVFGRDEKLAAVGDISLIDDQQTELAEKFYTNELKIKNILNTNNLLINESGGYLVNELREIYGYASITIDNALKDFESALDFHNSLVKTKKDFVSNDLNIFQSENSQIALRIQELEEKKVSLLSHLKSKQEISDVTGIVKNISDLNKELIKATALIEKKEAIDNKIDNETFSLKQKQEELNLEMHNVSIVESTFMEKFRKITQDFYGVDYNFSLNFDSEKGICLPRVDDIESNNEGGLKRLEVVAFDMAYIKTVISNSLKRPVFCVNDSIDDIDISNIRNIFKEAENIGGQYIVSMLSDKLTKDDYQSLKNCIILELSADDKFFKV